MTKPVVIFGTGTVAKAVHFYFRADNMRDIVAFTVDREHRHEEQFQNLPVIAFDQLMHSYPPRDYDLFIAMGYTGVNRPRKQKFLEAKALGYGFASYVSPRATVWPPPEHIGENCFIHDHNVVQPFSTIGDNVVMWTANVIGHDCVIEDHCFITGHAVIAGNTTVGEGSFIGLNATLRDGITIGRHNVIGAGALILKNTQDEDVYAGQMTPLFPKRSSELDTL